MGLFDKIKRGVKSAAQQPPPTMETTSAAPQAEGPTFFWDGDTHALPNGWSGLSIEDWFFRYETVRDRMMNVEAENLPPMNDEDGDPLDAEEALLVSQYGFQSGGHWEAFSSWGISGWASQTGESFTDCAVRMSGIARERLMAEKAGGMRSEVGGGGQLDAVEGISCEQWAQANAQIAGGGNLEGILGQCGMDRAKWDRVNAAWLARMQADTSHAISTVYANAFAGASQGQHGAQAAQAASAGVGGNVGGEPVPFERFVEIEVAIRAASDRGEDVTQAMAGLGVSPVDWSNIGMYWSKRIQQEAVKYHALHTQYTAQYEQKYGVGHGDGLTDEEREVKVKAEVLQMAKSGNASQILAYLKKTFPDDAGDNDALDWWLDAACDQCGEDGDRATAQALLTVRYPLQEDEDDPLEEWVASELSSLF